MSRMNAFRRQKALTFFRTKSEYYDKKTNEYLCFCGGQYCAYRLTEKQVIVEHKNNDNSDDSHRNIRPASRSCNTRIGFIQRKKYPKVKRDRIKYNDPPATMKKNMEIKAKAKEWLAKNITAGVSLLRKEVEQRLAFHCDCNVLTTSRLLDGLIVNEEPACMYMWHREEEEEFVRLKTSMGPS